MHKSTEKSLPNKKLTYNTNAGVHALRQKTTKPCPDVETRLEIEKKYDLIREENELSMKKECLPICRQKVQKS
jgi:hypothetical protein